MRISFNRSQLLPPFLALAMVGGIAIPLSSCIDREVAKVDPKQNREQEKLIRVPNRDLDILFVIDNSGSMGEEQTSLVANFDNFIDKLNEIENAEGNPALPNTHIGVISTNVGTGVETQQQCGKLGDNGKLQNTPRRNNCPAPGPEPFIKDYDDGNGGRTRNYNGTLKETFSCIAELGTAGCGFEQPLEAMKRALDGRNPENTGFLRKNAYLAVVIITDEDDCSGKNSLFNTAANLDSMTSELGPLESFRCFEHGVECAQESRTVGVKQECKVREDAPYFNSITDYVTFLSSLKDDPISQVVVAGIYGDPNTSVEVVMGQNTKGDEIRRIRPSCSVRIGNIDSAAFSGLRIEKFLQGFPQNTSNTICNEDLSSALTKVAQLFADVLDDPCIEGDLQLVDGAPDCTVSDVLNHNQAEEDGTLIDKCNDSENNFPCYRFVKDTDRCTGDTHPTQLTFEVLRGTSEAPPNTTVVARCLAQ